MTDSSRIRLNVISEIALEGGNPRPIHMFRPGTFTDMLGRETSFSLDDVTTIVQRFNATRRRKPPITERHDFGRAIGRLQDVWADAQGNLYGMPKWNGDGRTLLENEIYDGFSCELDHDEHGYLLIGGSLTNYPAVGGLEPVTLAAPPMPEPTPAPMPEPTPAPIMAHPVVLEVPPLTSAPPASVPARADRQPPTQGVVPMSDILDAPVITDPAVLSQMEAYVQHMEQRSAAAQEAALSQVRADFERRIRETEQRGMIEQFARAKVTTTTDQAYALPCTAEELTQLLLETPASVRPRWQSLLNRVTASGLVTFDEIGSSAGSEQADQWQSIVNAKVAAGLSRVEAIKQTAKDHPGLYQAQSAALKGRR